MDEIQPSNCTPADALRNSFVITFVGSERDVDAAFAHQRGWRPQQFPAVLSEWLDFDSLSTAAWPLLRGHHRKLALYEYTLALSHRQLYSLVLLNRLPCALVFESDVALVADFPRAVERLPGLSSTAFDVIKLEYCPMARRLGPSPLRRGERPAIVPGEGGFCTAAYIVSRSGAETLHRAQAVPWMNADGIMEQRSIDRAANVSGTGPARKLRVFHTVPHLAWQEDIDDGEKADRRGRPHVIASRNRLA